MKLNKKIIAILVILVSISLGLFYCSITKQNQDKNSSKSNVVTYNMTDNDIKSLPTDIIENKTVEDEQTLENDATEVENNNISYDGDSYFNISLGDYAGLTYYSQLDSRWGKQNYTSSGNSSQTIASSGCGPTSSAMLITAERGTITPDYMSQLFVANGFRSANNGTYWSAYSWLADTFNLDYTQTTLFSNADDYFDNNHYIIVACGNGLFTTGRTLYIHLWL